MKKAIIALMAALFLAVDMQAQGEGYYDIWVAGDQVTSENIKAVMVRFRKSRRMLGQFQLTNPNLRFLAPKKAAADGTGA